MVMQSKPTDRSAYDRIRAAIEGTPGFTRNQSTVQTVLPMLGWTATYIVETVWTDEGRWLFVQAVTEEGTVRMALPSKVADAIYRQRDAVAGKRRSAASRRTAETLKAKGVIPFQARKEV